MNFGLSLPECDVNDNLVTPPHTQFVQADWKFRIINIVGNDYVVHILHFPASYPNAATLNPTFYATAAGSPVYYRMTADQYKIFAERLQPKHSFTFGAATTIIKIRPGSKKLINNQYPAYFDFANDFNLGALFGYKNKPNRKVEFVQNFLVGVSLSSISVDSATTQGTTKISANNSALTFSLGYVGEVKRFQLGVFGGIDLLSGEVGRKWVYRNRPWVGLTVGISIFRTSESQSGQ
jgi:hypothetical protein